MFNKTKYYQKGGVFLVRLNGKEFSGGRSFALWGSVLAIGLLLSTLLPGCGGGGGAVTRIVSGVLRDAVTGQPIDGATVKLYQVTKGGSRLLIFLGQDTTKNGGKYGIPIGLSVIFVGLLAVEPPEGSDYEPVEIQTNLDASQDIDLDVVIIAKPHKPTTLTIIPPEGPYIAGQTYQFGYEARDQSGQIIPLKGINWYAQGDLATIDSQGNFIARSSDTCIIGLILSKDCETHISIPIIAPPQLILVGSSASQPLRALLESAGFNVQMQSTVPTNIGDAKALVIDDTAKLTTSDAGKVENILNKGGNIVLIGDAPAMLATGKPLPPNNPYNQNWTPTDISPIGGWFGGAGKMLHVYDINVHALSGGDVPLTPGISPDDILECMEVACVLTPLYQYPHVSVIAATMYWLTSPNFPNTENDHMVFAFAQEGVDGMGRLYWQWDYIASSQWEQYQPGSDAKIKKLFLSGVKWAARLGGPQP